MFAVLGDIPFDLVGYFDGFDATFGADYAEHALIDGKPRLQRIADRLDEIRIALSFHYRFCDPEAELAKLHTAQRAGRAMALVFGNGDYKGWFVLTEVQATHKQSDPSGSVLALDASITLKEYAGDKLTSPLPPAVQPKVPPAAAQAMSQTAADVKSAINTVRGAVRQVVSYASQARAALRIASDAVSVVREFRHDPIAALGRAPGVLLDIKRAAEPLEKLSPAVAAVTAHIPDAATILRASHDAAVAVQAAYQPLANATLDTIGDAVDTAARELSNAVDAIASAAPSVSKLAAAVATRRI
ncbi:phage tail protein [Burkholderia thailandensis]|uniref:phage tail protein n=1 Tax=Burkholderia thailandensis TaxID=57975 RepID=UPI00107EA3F5|nr:phage tail protein [Burkholderia thailandensis]MCZ2899151.1 phage tail protein [Burkholderia thailandensis]MDD1479566.1 phage tail protein [Burkholderia thailandensis]MDD1485135.1 phage tail protein [Burkholderia thailandensis]MDD1491844.1 phage tail protein [Burkholderia thailandensis]TGB31978.1 phage tail protein [Burkholderia thailandensis]